MDFATVKQITLIRKIEKYLDIPFEGTSIDEASGYISKHLEAFKQVAPPTEKQQNLIDTMNQYLDETKKFTGGTCSEATHHISTHFDAFMIEYEYAFEMIHNPNHY